VRLLAKNGMKFGQLTKNFSVFLTLI